MTTNTPGGKPDMLANTTAHTTVALAALKDVRSALKTGRLDARTAANNLSGARANRARELEDKLADALAHAERLVFVVTGDLHADEADV